MRVKQDRDESSAGEKRGSILRLKKMKDGEEDEIGEKRRIGGHGG